jgi:hypothetical protein
MNRRRLLAAMTVLVTLHPGGGPAAAPPPSPSGCEVVIPCADPRGCPDLLPGPRSIARMLINESYFDPTDCEVQDGWIAAGYHRLLYFDTEFVNAGPGDMIVGGPALHPGAFEFSECHGHHHLRGYADSRLWTPEGFARWQDLKRRNPDVCTPDLLEAHAAVAAEMVAGHKVGFCVVDIERVCGGRPTYRFGDCDVDQGISAGWADIYTAGIPGQWIAIDGLAPGRYVYEVEINPLRITAERDYLNNTLTTVVTIP